MWAGIKALDAKWKVLISAGLLVGLWVAGSMVRDRVKCASLLNQAETAFSTGNFEEAESYYRDLVYGGDRVYFRHCPNRPVINGLYADNLRLVELESYNPAVRALENGDYRGAQEWFQIYLENYSGGELREEAERRLAEIRLAMSQDAGQGGAELMLEMYAAGCGTGEGTLPSLDAIVDHEADPRYWYPQANAGDSSHIAETPAEFRIAVCAEVIQSDIVETCVYTPSGALGTGELGSSSVRKSAVYEIELVDILTGETLARHRPVAGKPPAACPQTMSGSTLFEEILGDPDLAAATAWIDGQVESLK